MISHSLLPAWVRLVAVCALAVGLASCTGGESGTTAPTTPTAAPVVADAQRYTLSGMVSEITPGGSVGVEAVTVTILDGPNAGISTQTRSRLRGVTAMTDADGFYQLTNLVGGGFTVQFSKDGYRLARRGVDIRTNLTENVELEALAPPPRLPNARYRVSFEADWSAQTHPTDFPSNPHFSRMIGATHGSDVMFWEPGAPATAGIQNVAELGSTSPFDAEIAQAQTAGLAENLFIGGGLDPSPGVEAVEFEIGQDYALVTLVSMIAPSPDWFVGVRNLSMLKRDWQDEIVVELFPWDAGTDSGVTFTSGDEATAPRGVITLLEGPPVAVGDQVPPFGRFIFRRVE